MPLLVFRYTKTSGVALNYAAMIARLRIAKDGGGYVEKLATLTNADTGEFVITWQPGDLLRGKHLGAVTILDGAGGILTTGNLLFDVLAPIE